MDKKNKKMTKNAQKDPSEITLRYPTGQAHGAGVSLSHRVNSRGRQKNDQKSAFFGHSERSVKSL